jgi:hypothetical protein
MTILQSRLSGMYFKDFGWWVSRAAEALQFESMEGARKFMAVERVADVVPRSGLTDDIALRGEC